ncbi:putative Ig domain-containing protein, partial [Candidatus Woesearchaeota archaeon]|nr:putative Ig domain-containing protein [Candidatus Woesearchaeota archaeon]
MKLKIFFIFFVISLFSIVDFPETPAQANGCSDGVWMGNGKCSSSNWVEWCYVSAEKTIYWRVKESNSPLCVTTCSNECTGGGRECRYGTGYYSDYWQQFDCRTDGDSDPCYEWVGTNSYCSAGCYGDGSCLPTCYPTDGGWNAWSSWSSCSASCGGGTQSRTRTCNNPAPACGGAECSGPSYETQSCNTQTCNSNPVINTISNQAITIGQPFSYQVSASDPNNDPVSYSLTQAPGGMLMTSAGLISWTPSTSQAGSYSVTVSVDDNKGGATQASFSITVSTLSAPASKAASGCTENRNLDYDNDKRIDIDDWNLFSAAFGKTSADAGYQTRYDLNSNSVVDFSDFVAFAVEYDRPLCNRNPSINPIANKEVTLNSAFSLTATGSDPDLDLLSYSLVSAPAGMTIGGGGNIVWIPSSSQLGSHTATVKVSDGRGGNSQTSFTIIVNPPPNNPPVVSSIPNQQVTEKNLFSYQVQASDPDGNILSYSLSQNPAGMSINNNGLITFTPTSSQVGAYSILVTVSDSKVNVGRGFTFTVLCAQNTYYKDLDNDGYGSSTAIQACTQPAGYSSNNLDCSDSNANIKPGATETCNNIDDNCNAQTDEGLSVNGGWNAWSSWSSCSASCGGGTQTRARTCNNPAPYCGGASCIGAATETQNCNTQACNNNPTISSIANQQINAQSNFNYQVPASDPDGDVLAYSLLQAPAGMSINSNGLISWKSASSQIGSHNVNVRASDGRGGIADKGFAITVLNNPPSLSISNKELFAGEVLLFKASADDIDNDALSYSLVQAPFGMSMDSFGNIRWGAYQKDVGVYNIKIRAADSRGASGEAAFSVTVKSVSVPGQPQIIQQIGCSEINNFDFNQDTVIDFSDFVYFATIYNTYSGIDSNFDSRADFDNNGKIDSADWTKFSSEYSKEICLYSRPSDNLRTQLDLCDVQCDDVDGCSCFDKCNIPGSVAQWSSCGGDKPLFQKVFGLDPDTVKLNDIEFSGCNNMKYGDRCDVAWKIQIIGEENAEVPFDVSFDWNQKTFKKSSTLILG